MRRNRMPQTRLLYHVKMYRFSQSAPEEISHTLHRKEYTRIREESLRQLRRSVRSQIEEPAGEPDYFQRANVRHYYPFKAKVQQ